MITKIDAIAVLYKGDFGAGDWVVIAVDRARDGTIVSATFSGIDAEQRAEEYAMAKFREYRRHAPEHQPCRSLQSPFADVCSAAKRRTALRLVK